MLRGVALLLCVLSAAFVADAQKTNVIKVGGLFPMFKPATDTSGIRRMHAFIMAVNEFNANSTFLPNHRFEFKVEDSKRDAGQAFFAAISVAQWGAEIVCGPASSGPTMNAALAFKTYKVPQASYSATSPALSSGETYPYFFRLPPSDAFQTVGLSELGKEYGWVKMAVMSDTSSYGASGAQAFIDAAKIANQVVLTYQVFSRDSSDITKELAVVKSSKARIIVVVVQASDGATLLHQGYSVGIGGPGYAWVGADGIMNSNLVDALRAKSITEAEVKFLSNGVIGLTPGRDETSKEWSDYTTLWGAQPQTLTAGGVCSNNQDASGNFIHRRGDVDNDATTPDACAGITTFDPSNPGSYAPYAYDIMKTYAYTAHRWFVDMGKTGSISADPDGFFAEIIKTSFNGATGPVGFDANGDRVVGARYLVVNFQDGSPINLGSWVSGVGFTYNSGVEVTWSDGSKGKNNAPKDATADDCIIGEGWDADLQECRTCPSGEYNLNGDASCRTCPKGAVCEGGYDISTLRDYWADPATMMTDVKTYRCRPGWCCDSARCPIAANGTACVSAAAPASTDFQDACSASQCGAHKVGILCGSCTSNAVLVSSTCVTTCSGVGGESLVVLILFAFAACTALLMVNHGNSLWGFGLIPEGMVKTFANYFNIMQLLEFTASVAVAQLFSLNSYTAVEMTEKCLWDTDALGNLLIGALFPFLAMGGLGVMFLFEMFHRATGAFGFLNGMIVPMQQRWRHFIRNTTRRLSRLGVLEKKTFSELGITKAPYYFKYTYVFTQLMLFSHSTIAIVVFRLFQCRKVGAFEVLAYAPGVECYKGDHSTFFAVAIILLCVYVIPLPLAALFLTYRMLKGGYEPNSDRIRFVEKCYGPLWVGYRSQFWWYEAFNVSRRIFIIALFVALDTPDVRAEQDSLFSKSWMAIFCLVLSCLHFMWKPFLHDIDNFIEGMFMISLAAVPMVDYSRVNALEQDVEKFEGVEAAMLYFPVGVAGLMYAYRCMSVMKERKNYDDNEAPAGKTAYGDN
ncbi:receptor family ligand binding domain-containing protein [Chloropicon primus]|uniref:Receptor ligand binding region domain-containing protein n=1 Tax=Chloropicon primus TaxID=1764295 RepID=A0A5B8MPJ4_9CHLO|nr:hypothetical protein A3770_05p37200 [Chloropicon primus]UPR00416.1 receptor family ligand binding domain-containing protein [Chloropicon primus]|eukprot:QDZ21202.1 hypothetical protein A3770_05p37200 [Chloropicon primus]